MAPLLLQVVGEGDEEEGEGGEDGAEEGEGDEGKGEEGGGKEKEKKK